MAKQPVRLLCSVLLHDLLLAHPHFLDVIEQCLGCEMLCDAERTRQHHSTLLPNIHFRDLAPDQGVDCLEMQHHGFARLAAVGSLVAISRDSEP